jgi:hypothetical protein
MRLSTFWLSFGGIVIGGVLGGLVLVSPAAADPTPECNTGPGPFSTECGEDSIASGVFATAVGNGAEAT